MPLGWQGVAGQDAHVRTTGDRVRPRHGLRRPLVAVRGATRFDRGFIERDALFWPLRPALEALGTLDDFPPVETLDRVFCGDPPVRFVAAAPRKRRSHAPDASAGIDARKLYDGRVTVDGEVPTRPQSWHDFMNALVWGTFPRAKLALHARQHRAIARRVPPGARTLPATRSRELDALALLDEGGVVVLARDREELRVRLRTEGPGVLRSRMASGDADALVFGHAIYESLALGVSPAVVAAIVLAYDGTQPDIVRAADHALMDAIRDDSTLTSPTELVRVHVREAAPRDPGDSRPFAEDRSR